MMLFRSEEHVERWLDERGLPRGATMTPEQQWELAQAWYSDSLSHDYRRKTPDEAEATFERIGLTGPFWRLAE